jgi:hypothetical protein
VKFTYTHGKELDAVKTKLEEVVPKMLGEAGSRVSNVDYRWDGNTARFSFLAMGRKIQGTAEVSTNAVAFDIGLPLMARPFEPQIKSRIIQALDDALA